MYVCMYAYKESTEYRVDSFGAEPTTDMIRMLYIFIYIEASCIYKIYILSIIMCINANM